MKSAADNIHSPNHFELLNCEITKNDDNDHPYHKDSFTVSSDKVNHFSKYKQSKRPKAVNRFQENQYTFHKNVLFRVKKRIKKLSPKKSNTTNTDNIF